MNRPVTAFVDARTVMLAESHGTPTQRTTRLTPSQARLLAAQLITAAAEVERAARDRRRTRFRGLSS